MRLLLALGCVCSLLLLDSGLALDDNAIANKIRVKRQQQLTGNSILTVEWEGIHSGVPDDKAIGGFIVEYRPETDTTFVQHDGLIRYQGPNVKYRVKIKDLPSGMIYYVRIKVIGRNNEVLVQTPEIKAQSETVQIVCDGKITQPRNIRIVSTTKHSVTYAWEAPECGNVQRYTYRVEGYSDWARFDVHTATVTDPQATISNLLPGTTYNFRILAIDSTNREGPWTDYMVRTTTEGSAPRTSDAIRVVYRTDSQIRVEWEPVTDASIQHYEVVILEQAREDEAVQVFRTQVPPSETGFLFTNLKPSTNYLVGVIAFSNFEPRQLYRLKAATAARGAQPWTTKPSVSSKIGKFVVQWDSPDRQFGDQDIKGFIIEYRLPNETTWRRYGSIIEYRPGQQDYTTELVGFSDRIVYVIRVHLLNKVGEVIAVTDEFTVGSPSTASCTGPQGSPVNAEAYYVGPTTITYSWNRPQCDESYGPVEGYEYSFWNLDRGKEPDRPTFISTNRVTLDNLTPNYRYAFKVRSRSRAGYSPWSEVLSSSTKPGTPDGNIYKLRIVLAVTKSYLVWTPVPQDRNRIDRFRVSYKVSVTDHWQRIEDRPDKFQCPPGVGDPGDFCYDLSDLKFGIQYTADVVYRLDGGEWSKQGNPLFFILVEAVTPIIATPEPPRTPQAPAQLTVTWQTETTALATWLPPLSADVRVDEYKITVRVLTSSNPHVIPGHVRVFTTPGGVFRYLLDNLYPDTVYNVSVVAGSRGYYGPPAFEIFGQVQVNPDIRQLRVEEQADTVNVKWDVAGPVKRICCYQIDLRNDRDPQWRPHGERIPQEGDRRYYTSDLRGLEGNTPYFVRVRGLGEGGDDTLCTSDSIRFQTHCQQPRAPPDNIDIRASDSRTVVVSWTHPDRSTWGCEDISYVVEATVNGRVQRIPLPADTRGFRAEHRLPSEPGAEWRIRVQTVNSGGVSPWSREYATTTPSEPYVTTPRLTAQGTQLRVDWHSQGRGAGVVHGYFIEYRTSQDPRWQRSGTIVPYQGDNMPYSGVISGLPRTGTTFVRILVLDKNQQVIFTSPEAFTESRCTAPSQSPQNVQIEAPDARHVRVSWIPPSPETWGCDDIFYELEVIEPRGTQSARANRGETVHIFDARPNERWMVQIRTVNSAGASQWARTAATKTPPPGELITGLFVSYPGGVPTLQWMSIDGVGDLVGGYRLEVMSETDRNWRSHSSGFIRYHGSQRPYVVTLDDLPEGQRVFVRVQVIDRNNGVAYTSPQVPVQTPTRCRPPTSFPQDARVTPSGTSRIQVSWRPLTSAEWNCDNGWYIVKYTTPSASGVRNFTSADSLAVFESPPSTTWQFQIQAENRAGASAWSPILSGSTETGTPGAVEDVRVTPAGPGSVRVTWRPPSGASGLIQAYDVTYQLLSRGLCVESPEPEITVTTRDPYYVLQGLHPHSRYRVTIVARTNVPGAPVSQEFTTEAAVPTAPPRSLQAIDITSRRVTLSWQGPPCPQTNGEVREYEYEMQGVDPWAVRETYKSRTADTRAIVDGLTPYTKYRAKVRAYTSQGPGPWSTDIMVTTEPSDDPPAPPLLRIVNARADAIDLFWQGAYPPHGDIDRYKVQFAISGTGRWSEREFRLDQLYCTAEVSRRFREQAPPGANTYCVTIGGLEPEQNYDFQVAAHVLGRRWGPWSNVESGRTGDGPVRVLSVESVAAGSDNLEIRWTVRPSDQGRVRGFRVTAHPLTQPLRIQQFTVDGPIFQYRIDGLEANTAYNVTVQGRTELSPYYEGTSATLRTVDIVLPVPQTPPRIIAKTANSVTVEWPTPFIPAQTTSPITGYIVEYKTPTRGEYVRHNSIVPHDRSRPAHTAIINGLPPNTDVSVRIRNVGKNNQISNPSPEATARTDCMEPSLPPQGIRLDTRGEPVQVIVTWQRPSESSWRCDQVSYEILYRTSDQPAEQVARVGPQQSEYSFPSPPYTRWFIKMRTVNRVGSSPPSEELSITTPEKPPDRPRNLKLTPLSPNEVLVQWDPPSDKPGVIVGYDVSYRLKHRLACPEEVPKDVSRAWITVYNVKGSEYTLTGLLPYSEYEVKLQARTTELGPETTKTVQTLQQPPSAPPLDLKSTFVLERGLGFSWQPIECSQRHGPVGTYEYELLGQDDWAKLEVRIANTTQLKLDIDGLTPFTKYIMRVKGYNSVGGGPSTADLEITTAKADAPLPPQDLTVMSEGHDFIAVSWLPPYPPYGPIDSYKVRYRMIDNRGVEGNWQTADLHKNDPRLRCPGAPIELPRLCFNMTQLESGVQYRIQVAARIEGGSYGPFCAAITANTLSPLPDAPRSITLLAKTSSSLKISWVPPDDPLRLITQYRVTAEPVTPKPGVTIKTFTVDAPKTELLMENLESDTAYNITVRASTVKGVGRGIWTTYTTDPILIPRVSTKPVISDVGPNHLVVEWNSAVDTHNVVQGYILQYRKSGEPDFREWGGIVRHDGIKRTYQERITGLEPDTTYVVRIKVVDHANRVGEPSPQAEARTGCQPPTSPPYDIRLTAESPNEVRLRWTPPPTNTWQCSQVVYRIQFRNGTLSPLSHTDVPGAVTEHVLASAPYTKWTIQMRSQNPAGSSDWSKEIEITTPETAPGVVRDLRGEAAGPDRIRVTWKPPTDTNGVIRSYIVSYVLKSKGDCPVPPSQPIIKEVHSEKQIIKDLEPASTYEIRVRAMTTVEGPDSEPILVTTEESTPTGPPTNVEVASLHKTGATITWDEPLCEHRNGEIKRYEYELEGVDAWVRGDSKRASVTAQRIEFSELLPYTKYRFHVRALNTKGAGPYSEFIEFTTRPGAPPPPRDLRTDTPSPTAIPISFLPPSPPHGIIDDYRIRYTTTDRISWHEVRKAPDELACVGVAADSQRLCYRIVDLEPKREYAIQVSAHTKDGDWGEWTTSHYQPTPEPDIPVPTVAPRVSDRKSDSVTVLWEGLDPKLMKHADGYVLEYNAGGSTEWVQHDDIIPTKGTLSGMIYSETVKGLQPDTAYAFRLRVVAGGKRGVPGPDVRTRTLCGKPSQPPRNLKPEIHDFNTIRLSWEAPPESTWRCSRVVYVIKYTNSTHSGQVDINPADGRDFYDFHSEPSTKWTFQMRTQATDELGVRGEASDWSPKVEIKTQGPPHSIYVDLQPRGPGSAQVTWDLPPEFRDWNYGVDVSYRLKQKGNCPPQYMPPVTLHNQQNKVILLDNLEPNSIYEVTVTARTPSHMMSAGLTPPKEVKEIRTGPKEPEAPPQNIRVNDVSERSATFSWEPPPCDKQNGEITQYEYSLTGIDDWAAGDLRQATTSRLRATVHELMSGTRYRLQIRAYTSVGAGPWSESVEIKTAGPVVGAPRELHPIEILSRQATLTWLPPSQQRGYIDSYRLKYSARDGSQSDELTLRPDQLTCRRHSHAAISTDSLCYTLTGLRPLVNYEVQAQARSSTGVWSDWSTPAAYFTTPERDPIQFGGDLRLVFAEPESLKVRWSAPDNIAHELVSYRVFISEAYDRTATPLQHFDVPANQLDYTFVGLKPNTVYNVSVEGSAAGGRVMWAISKNFQTADRSDGCVDWLPAPSNLELLEKTQTSMFLTWAPPEILIPAFNELFTHYNVTITPWDVATRKEVEGRSVSKIVNRPGNRVSFDGLDPATVYNISIQPRTKSSCGETLWGVYSTLPYGATHILRLKWRTPTSLHVGWLPSWGANVNEYTLTATALSGESYYLEPKVISVPGSRTEYVIEGLTPATVYNVTLVPKDKTNLAWGAYATLPYGHIFVRNARYCDKKEFEYPGRPFWPSGTYSSIALSWTPPTKDSEASTSYQVRYRKPNSNDWVVLPVRSHYELRCPGDGLNNVPCERLCYLLYNLTGPVSKQLIQVRVFSDNTWNRWKTVVDSPISEVAQRTPEDQACCIVPPPYFVDFVGEEGTLWPVVVRAVPNDTHIFRYYVVVDERDPAGEVDPKLLFDKVTAKARNIPYYIAGAFDRNTLPLGRDRLFTIGDGEVYGGYLNYPLIKGKKYNWFFIPHWRIGDKPVYGILHQGREIIHFGGGITNGYDRTGRSNQLDVAFLLGGKEGGYYRDSLDQLAPGQGSYIRSEYIGGWPWWWLLLFLLLLLLLILLLCCLLWCCLGSRYRRRKRVTTVSREEYPPLLLKTEGSRKDLSDDLARLEQRLNDMKSSLDRSHVVHTTVQGSRDGDRDTDTISSYEDNRRSRRRRQESSGKGDFEEGYVRGFRDANKLGTGAAARERLDTDYAGMRREWQAGYVAGLGDAGLNLSRSMRDLAARPSAGGYSAGYTQGFREGSTAMWGDKINMQMLRRLEELYPDQDDFRQGYIDGYKEALASRDTHDNLNKSLDDISQRLKNLEVRQQDKGDEIHTTKIYHVYNQLPEAQTGYATSGQQLAQELEELSTSSRRSTLRRHYTPGDYLKYASDTEGGAGYSSLRRHRRSLSASALGRDVGAYSADGLGRRYPSQTILDGVRPGPTAPTHRREALETLQRELDTISRGSTTAGGRTSVTRGARLPISVTDSARGYSSDTGYINDTWRSRPGFSGPRPEGGYDAYQQHVSRTEKHTYSGGVDSGTAAAPYPRFHSPTTAAISPSSGLGLSGGRSSASSMVRTIPVQVAGSTAVGATSTGGVSGSDKIKSPIGASASDASHAFHHSPGRYAASTTSSISSSSAAQRPLHAAGTSLAQAYNLVGLSGAESSGSEMERAAAARAATTSGRTGMWTDELMDIVNEPLEESLDRMKKYSTSLSKLPPSPAPTSPRQDFRRDQGTGEGATGAYSSTYKEEYTTSGGTGV